LKTYSFIIFLLFTFFLSSCEEKKSNSDTNLNLIRGLNAFELKHYDLVQYYLDIALKNEPDNTEAQLKIAQSYMLVKYQNIDKAIKYYTDLLLNNSIDSIINTYIISDMQEIGMQKQLLNIIPKLKSNLYKAKIYASSDINKALESFKVINDDNKKNDDYYLLGIEIHFTLKNFIIVNEYCEKLTSKGILNKRLYYLCSQSYLKSNYRSKEEHSINIYSKINNLTSKVNPSKKLDTLKALLELNRGFSINNDFNVLHLSILLKDGQINLANNLFEKIKTLELTNKQITLLLNVSLAHSYKPIIRYYYNQGQLDKLSEGETIIYCQYFIKNNSSDNLDNICSLGLDKYPTSASLNYWVGYSELIKNNNPIAIKYLSLAINYAPWIDDWRIQLATLHLIQGDITSAKDVVETTLNPNNPKIKQFKLKNGI